MRRTWMRVPFGIIVAAAASFALARLFAGSELGTVLPLAFIVVLVGLSRRYGASVGVVGSLLCAVIFAHYLFEPTGTWRVEDLVARRNLLWMVVGTIALSYLFAPSDQQHDRSQH